MPKKKLGQGFTLIELMIVIAILAILLATAIPAYQDYTIRAKVSEGLNTAASARTMIVETFHSRAAVPDQAATGWTFSGTDYVTSITIASDGSGTIIITTQDTGAAADPVLELVPSLVVGAPTTWQCNQTAGLAKHVPAQCR